MSLADGQDLSEWEGGLFDPKNENSVSLLFRLLWIFTEWRSTTPDGLSLTEAGRPQGVPSDIDVGRSGKPETDTASGRSTVNYQWGRFLLWLDTKGAAGTPSAANPNGTPSRHQVGTASDLKSNDYDRLDELAERVGMKRTIGSEIWHYEIYRDPDPDIDFSRFSAVVRAIFGQATTAGDHTTTFDNRSPEQKEWDDIMTNADDLQKSLQAILAALGQPKDDATKTAAIVRNYSAEKGVNVATAVIFPDKELTAIRLTQFMDVTAIEVAMVQVFGLLPTGWDQPEVATRYPGQLNDAQWRNFWQIYPGKMIGFRDEDFLPGKRPVIDGKPKGQ